MPCRDSRSHDAGAVRKPRKDAVMLSCGKGTYLKRKTESHHQIRLVIWMVTSLFNESHVEKAFSTWLISLACTLVKKIWVL